MVDDISSNAEMLRDDGMPRVFHMGMHETPFSYLCSVKKSLELRLYDEKRQELRVNDSIYFYKQPEKKERILTTVTGLIVRRSFSEIVDEFTISRFGYPADSDVEKFLESLYELPGYTKAREEKYGVLGISVIVFDPK